MSETVIKVENLSKQYRIGSKEGYKTLRETLVDAAKAPFQRLQEAWRMAHGAWSNREDSQGTSNLQAHSPLPPSQRDDLVWALKDVSFEVKKGEVVGIIGRNGAGKSTLLKILSKITYPTEGRVELTGRVGSLLEVGTGFHPELTGHENVYLYGAILGMDRWEVTRKFDEIIEFAELEKFVDTPIKRYSSGMYMRLAFAVAAHLEPEILLVDEVLAVGDAAFQKKCLGKMGAVSKEGRTVLFVSHNMAAVRKLCSSAILLKSGKKEIAGQSNMVIDQYLSSIAEALSPTVELPRCLPNSPGSGTRLLFLNAEGKAQAQFQLGETWRITLEFELFKPLQHVIAAVGLVNLDTVPIVTYWSMPKDLLPGRYSVEFLCEVPLKACDIQFVVGLSSYERAFYYVEDIGHVSISTVAQDEQPFRASEAGMLLSRQDSEIKSL